MLEPRNPREEKLFRVKADLAKQEDRDMMAQRHRVKIRRLRANARTYVCPPIGLRTSRSPLLGRARYSHITHSTKPF